LAKYWFECLSCGRNLGDFGDLIERGRVCDACATDLVQAKYESSACLPDAENPSGVWRYFDILPVHRRTSVITAGEGHVPLERWGFLESYARLHGINCTVYAHRHDNNPATGSFKDLAGSVVASCLREAGVDNVVVASTGNIGVSFARYLSAAGISLYVFIPENSSRSHDAEIGMFGQKAFRVQGDYAFAKQMAAEFATRHGNLVSVKARLEVKVVDRKSGRVVAIDRQTHVAVDLVEQIAGKQALQEAAADIAERLLPKIIKHQAE
jgi:threonine synthase